MPVFWELVNNEDLEFMLLEVILTGAECKVEIDYFMWLTRALWRLSVCNVCIKFSSSSKMLGFKVFQILEILGVSQSTKSSISHIITSQFSDPESNIF
jgi:hypothetical protein